MSLSTLQMRRLRSRGEGSGFPRPCRQDVSEPTSKPCGVQTSPAPAVLWPSRPPQSTNWEAFRARDTKPELVVTVKALCHPLEAQGRVARRAGPFNGMTVPLGPQAPPFSPPCHPQRVSPACSNACPVFLRGLP